MNQIVNQWIISGSIPLDNQETTQILQLKIKQNSKIQK